MTKAIPLIEAFLGMPDLRIERTRAHSLNNISAMSIRLASIRQSLKEKTDPGLIVYALSLRQRLCFR